MNWPSILWFLSRGWWLSKTNTSVFLSPEGKPTFHLGRICQPYLTKSGLRVFGFCPAGSTQRDFFRIPPYFQANTASQRCLGRLEICQASNQNWTTVTNYIAKINTHKAEVKNTVVKAIATKVRMMTGNVLPPKMLRFAQTK